MSQEHPVERYYERNTRRFLAFGGGRASAAIHRQLWGPGVTSPAEACAYVNRLVEGAVEALFPTAGSSPAGAAGALGSAHAPGAAERPGPVVLDIGCGVGGTLVHLAARFPGGRFHGVTISPRQVALARALAAAAGVEPRCRFERGDFDSLEIGIAADVIVAVESYAHSLRPAGFFATARRHLAGGGRLVVVDDFLRDTEAALPAAARLQAARFRRGWRVPAFGTVAECVAAAHASGLALEHDRDLTPLIRLDRPRDRIIAALAPAIARLGLDGVPFFGNLAGGNALRDGLKTGNFTYRWLAFRAAPDPGTAATAT